MTDEKPSYHYWAFISYSSKDQKWASWLHKFIETYRIPTQLIRHPTPIGDPAPERFQPVFHDRSELPASAELGERIEAALLASRYLIVICSPHAAKSKWVNREVETFQQLQRAHNTLAIIVAGEPNSADERECFPPTLREREPLAADARPDADGKHNAALKLLAGMLGVSFDALKQRDNQRRIQRLKVALAFALVALAAFVSLALYANHQRMQALRTLATSDFREGINRLRYPETSSEGIAFLARAARAGTMYSKAHVRLWSLLQQREFWVEAPPAGDSSAHAPLNTATNVDPRFATVAFKGQQMKPAFFSRSGDGQKCVTIVNDDEGGFFVHHFRVWHSNGIPITPWTPMAGKDADLRELVSAHLSPDGRFVAVIGEVWREPQIMEIWDTKPLRRIGDPIQATGRHPEYQSASFNNVRFLPSSGDPTILAFLLTGSSRGDATIFKIKDESPSTISIVDHLSLPSLASKLKSPSRPVDIWLAGQLSAESKAALAAYQGDVIAPQLEKPLSQDFNRVIQGAHIYDAQRFSGVTMRSETKAMLSDPLDRDDFLRLQRMLLEDVYSEELFGTPQRPALEPVGQCKHATSVQAVAVDDSMRWLMSASADRQMLVLDLATEKPVGNPILLNGIPQHVSKIAPDRIRVSMAGAQITEYQLIPALAVPPSRGGAFRTTALIDNSPQRNAWSRGARGVSLPPTNNILAVSPDKTLAIRVLRPTEIEAGHVAASGVEPIQWRRSFSSPVCRVCFERGGQLLVVRTDDFRTEVIGADSGRRVGSPIDETRAFGDSMPKTPSDSSVGTLSDLVLTTSFSWEPPNLALYWFTVWDLASGLPLTDVLECDSESGEEDSACFSPDDRFLLLGSDSTSQAIRCIQLDPPPEIRGLLPDAAEALGGLALASDGSFLSVTNRLRKVESFFAGWRNTSNGTKSAR